MVAPYFCSQTIDDALRKIIDEINSRGEWIQTSKGRCKEITGILIEITNPRARLSRTETRGKLFSALGELCWYLAGSNQVDFISYYLKKYEEYADGNLIFGGYGPRFLSWKSTNQISNIINLLQHNPNSRKAVIQLFDSIDITEPHKDIPCTCVMQFMIRNNSLDMITFMRSNDVFQGFSHDVFSFTMLQEILARTLNVDLGIYKHFVGSLHIYEKDVNAIKQFMDEGWQSTEMPMPQMPIGDPWFSIKTLLLAENAIRIDEKVTSIELKDLDPYWHDLIRLLLIFRYSKNRDYDSIKKTKHEMASLIYSSFIDKRLNDYEG